MGAALSVTKFITSPNGAHDLVEQGRDFSPSLYLATFASFYFSHVRGFRELRRLLLLDPAYTSAEHVQASLFAERFAVQPDLPAHWKHILPASAKWGPCSRVQIDRLCDGKPSRLDQSLQGMLALQRLFERSSLHALRQLDVFVYLNIVPLTYFIAAEDRAVAKFLRGDDSSRESQKKWRELIAKLYRQKPCTPTSKQVSHAKAFLMDVSKGYPLTWSSAETIRPYISDGASDPSIKYLPRRKDAKRKPKGTSETALSGCDGESTFIQLDEKRLAQLETIKEQLARAPISEMSA